MLLGTWKAVYGQGGALHPSSGGERHQPRLELIEDIRTIYDNYDFKTEIAAASIRSVSRYHRLRQDRRRRDHRAFTVIKAMANNVLTDKGLDQFLQDWAKTRQKIV